MGADQRAPRFSVILPVFNGMPWLADAIASIRAQTTDDWELIAVDDGSRDESARLLDTAAAADPRIRIVTHAENRGIAAAYNTGLGQARGRFLAFQEQDDLSHPERLVRESEALLAHDAAVVSSCVELVDSADRVREVWPPDVRGEVERTPGGDLLARRILTDRTNIANSTTLLDRERIDPVELVFDEQFRRCCQDADWQIRLVRRYPSLRLARPLVRMRRSADHSSATSVASAMVPDMRRLLKKQLPLLTRNTPPWTQLTTRLRAWSNQCRFEAGIHRASPVGWGLFLAALLLSPANPRIWKTGGVFGPSRADIA